MHYAYHFLSVIVWFVDGFRFYFTTIVATVNENCDFWYFYLRDRLFIQQQIKRYLQKCRKFSKLGQKASLKKKVQHGNIKFSLAEIFFFSKRLQQQTPLESRKWCMLTGESQKIKWQFSNAVKTSLNRIAKEFSTETHWKASSEKKLLSVKVDQVVQHILFQTWTEGHQSSPWKLASKQALEIWEAALSRKELPLIQKWRYQLKSTCKLDLCFCYSDIKTFFFKRK